MIKKTYYICSKCGAKFKTKAQCEKHEHIDILKKEFQKNNIPLFKQGDIVKFKLTGETYPVEQVTTEYDEDKNEAYFRYHIGYDDMFHGIYAKEDQLDIVMYR